MRNGSNTWISIADVADVLIYYAYTDRNAGAKGLSAFVIEPKNFNGVRTTRLDKMGSLETVNKCANYAMRILGAYGYSTEYPIARIYRDTPTYSMVEGSTNICKWIIALDQLGYRKADR